MPTKLPHQPIICTTPHKVKSSGVSHSVKATGKDWSEDLVFNTDTTQSGHHISLFPSLNTPFHFDGAKLKPLQYETKPPSWIPPQSSWRALEEIEQSREGRYALDEGNYIYPFRNAPDEELNTATLEIFLIIIFIYDSNFTRTTFSLLGQIITGNTWTETFKKGVLLNCQQAKRNTYL